MAFNYVNYADASVEAEVGAFGHFKLNLVSW